MLRGLVKSGAAAGLERSGLLRLAARGRPADVARVVGYHRVVEDFSESARSSLRSMLTSRRTFERHLEWMGRRFRFVPLSEVTAPAARGRRPLAVSFDDGYRDVYDVAFPVLKKMGVPAGVFVVTSLVGTSRPQVHDRLFLRLERWFARRRAPVADLERLLARHDLSLRGGRLSSKDDAASATRALLRSMRRGTIERLIDALQSEVEIEESRYPELQPLTWAMLDEMARNGITIGSHTRSHVALPLETGDVAREEIERSKAELEERLSIAVSDFAYPDGQFDERSVAEVARAGFERGFGTCRHRSAMYPELTIPRKLLWERACLDGRGRFSPAVLSCQLEGVFDWASSCEHPARRTRADNLKGTGNDASNDA